MRLSLAIGVLLLVGKTAAWLLTGSSAILSDAVESAVPIVAVAFAAIDFGTITLFPLLFACQSNCIISLYLRACRAWCRMRRISISLGRFVVMGMIASGAALAQSSDAATLQTLLSEVRELRLAMERIGANGPRIQIALQRVQWQDQRVTRAQVRVESVRGELTRITSDLAQARRMAEAAEQELATHQDVNVRKPFEDNLREMKLRVERFSRTEQQLRGEEADAAAAFRTEEAKMDEIAQRLIALERAVDGKP